MNSSVPEKAIARNLTDTGNATCNGLDLRNLLRSGQQWLEAHAELVNNLNVYPVPDGDTGTNMVLTMRAALAQTAEATDHQAGTIAVAAAHGALMGARGNSGVILSQFLQGMAEALQGRNTFTTADFACALQQASRQAYRSVPEPVEGTILTVARAMADAARQSAARYTDLQVVLADTLHAAKVAQAGTPLLLPVLKEAGVTDSGGQGLVYILEGGLRYLQHEPVDVAPVEAEVIIPKGIAAEPYGYDVQFLVRGTKLDVTSIRAVIGRMGESVLVVGDEQLVKVHLHAPDPGAPLSYGARQGSISEVVVENLDLQARAFAHSAVNDEPASEKAAPLALAAIAVASGDGFGRIFRSLGVNQVVSGGQTHNPSVDELLAAINRTSAQHIVILPNNSNVILPARQAQQVAQRDGDGKRVTVLPTHTLPQGIAAMLSFNARPDVETTLARMAEAMAQIKTIEITRAVRSSQLNGFRMKSGDVMGLLEQTLVAVGQAVDEVTAQVLSRLEVEAYEIATIYFGREQSPRQAAELAQKISTLYSDLEIEVHAGGQAYYDYIISME